MSVENLPSFLQEADVEEVNKQLLSQIAEEAVNHPPHYGGDTAYEVIKCLEAWAELNPLVMDLNIGQAIIYLARAGVKDPSKDLEDVKKARWWLDRWITKMEKAL